MKHDSSLTGPEGIQYGNYASEPVTKGRIDFLEMFGGSAKLSQVAAIWEQVTICYQPKAGEEPWKP